MYFLLCSRSSVWIEQQTSNIVLCKGRNLWVAGSNPVGGIFVEIYIPKSLKVFKMLIYFMRG